MLVSLRLTQVHPQVTYLMLEPIMLADSFYCRHPTKVLRMPAADIPIVKLGQKSNLDKTAHLAQKTKYA